MIKLKNTIIFFILIFVIIIMFLSFNNKLECPENYILIERDNYFTNKDFCVMKYQARAYDTSFNTIIYDGCGNLTNLSSCNFENSFNNWADLSNVIPISSPEGSPWRRISFNDAVSACQNLGKNYRLITNREWMTIARKIESNKINWNSNEVRVGYLSKGLHKLPNLTTELYKNLSHPAPNSSDECLFAYVDEYNIVCSAEGDFRFKRTHVINNNIIWDFAGNVWEWVDATENGESFNGRICENEKWNHFNNCKISKESIFQLTSAKDKRFEIGSLISNSTNHGIGMVYSSNSDNRVFKRGGSWVNLPASGIFGLDARSSPSGSTAVRGFRCTYS